MDEYKDLIEVLDFGFSLGNGVEKSLEDGDLDLWDSKNFLESIKLIKPAIDGIANIPGSILEMDEAGRDYVCKYFKEKFDLADDVLEERIEKGLQIALSIVGFVNTLKKK